jgi:predicted RNA-binding protein with RPS1 domain
MESLDYFMNRTREGDVLPAVITHLAQFGAFADIGCGIISMIGIENISVARIFHPSERFSVGQKIYAVVSSIDRTKKRVTLTHKELLGTWQQNASKFSAGDTVTGIIRSIKPYGLFIELTPNLSGLSEYNDKYITGDTVSVYIKSITSEKMKIKLSIIGRVCDSPFPSPFEYFLPESTSTDGYTRRPAVKKSSKRSLFLLDLIPVFFRRLLCLIVSVKIIPGVFKLIRQILLLYIVVFIIMRVFVIVHLFYLGGIGMNIFKMPWYLSEISLADILHRRSDPATAEFDFGAVARRITASASGIWASGSPN